MSVWPTGAAAAPGAAAAIAAAGLKLPDGSTGGVVGNAALSTDAMVGSNDSGGNTWATGAAGGEPGPERTGGAGGGGGGAAGAGGGGFSNIGSSVSGSRQVVPAGSWAMSGN